MCGLVGFVGQGSVEDLRRMVATLEHRGPDDEGVFVDEGLAVYLGLRRLEVIDVASGQQPMATPDGELVVVFNGELYNAPELREELERAGHVFTSSHSDTEVLLHGYRAWGDALVDRLNGMWAFALLDRRRRRLFLSRDRFGQKPLYWLQRRGTFAFASEPQALAAHEQVTLSLSASSLRKYFAHGYFPGTHSAYEGVRRLDAGCNLSLTLGGQTAPHDPSDVDAARPQIHRYWSYRIEPEGGLGPRSEERWAGQVGELLERAVRRRLRSDVPLGLFLSGGLDSSAIGALARPHLGDHQLKSFSIGFSDSSFDETDDARAMAAWLGSEHTVEVFSADRFQGLSRQVFDQLDEPLSDSSMLSYALLCERARQDVTVALGGDAGDELFAGYG
ncbi:MAG TPA: asparagine synthase (glutamine-hydrolyzing), partial [Deltaproteobacteria bacterium]|nr:asparagine synthase (glutamine-hydrolyzing) [Deltaproteobacteria bacterium]